MALDTLFDPGWLKQVQMDDIEDAAPNAPHPEDGTVDVAIACYLPGISVIRASWNVIAAGTQDGLVHVFDREGSLKETFQVCETAVSNVLLIPKCLKACQL